LLVLVFTADAKATGLLEDPKVTVQLQVSSVSEALRSDGRGKDFINHCRRVLVKANGLKAVAGWY